jgi:hypothetical protein
MVQNKLSMLYESVDNISNAKKLEDKHGIQLQEKMEKIKILMSEIEEKDVTNNFLINDRDKFRGELAEMSEA